jgi:hypothetical protein
MKFETFKPEITVLCEQDGSGLLVTFAALQGCMAGGESTTNEARDTFMRGCWLLLKTALSERLMWPSLRR